MLHEYIGAQTALGRQACSAQPSAPPVQPQALTPLLPDCAKLARTSAPHVNSMDELRERITEWSRRARLQRGLALLFFGLACGLGIALVIALASRAFPLMATSAVIVLAIVLALAGVSLAFVWPWLRAARTQPIEWARRFDHAFSLQERISTALEIADGDIPTHSDLLRNSQRKDATRIIESVNAKKLLPLTISRRDALVSLFFLVALVAALALPNPQQQILAQREELRRTIAQQVQQLEQAKQAIQQSALTDAQKKLAMDALDDARRKLEDPNVTPEEAMAAINEAQSTLDALNDEAARQQADDLQRAGESLSPDELTNNLSNALANQDFQRAAEELRNLGTDRQTGQPLTEEEQQRAANQLDQLARGVQNSDPQLAQQMREAAQQLREGNAQQAQQSLQQAANALQQAQQQTAASQALDNAQQRAEAARQAIAEQMAQQQQQAQAGQTQQGQESQQGQQGQQGDGGQQGATMAGDNQAGAQQPSAASAQGGQPSSQNTTQKSDDFGSADQVYAPQRIGSDGKQVVLPDSQGQAAPNAQGRPNTAPAGSSTVPYEQVYGDYAKAADDAMQTGQVPAEMRDYVRDYFSSLNPRQQNNPNR